MLINSIDILDGQCVQLVGGERLELEAGDPLNIARRFGPLGEFALIDLNAAMGTGENRSVIERICRTYRCRVGGGIRDYETARWWLNAGAASVIIGTAAHPDLLSQLPKERVIVALDAKDGEVVVNGWKKRTGRHLFDEIERLAPFVSGFLVTFVEREGRMTGTDLDMAQAIKRRIGDRKLTVAGGIKRSAEIKELDDFGIDAQVGMSIYKGDLDIADAFAAPLRSDRADGLWPTVVVDEFDRALGLVYSNMESLRASIQSGKGTYFSRSRGTLWVKGESSGHGQEILDISMDCDRDTLRFRVRQAGPGFCHLESRTCWGELGQLPRLEQTIRQRMVDPEPDSFTHRLLTQPSWLNAKLREEADELANAQEGKDVQHEAADVLYFMMVAMARKGVSLSDVYRELDLRALKVSRRAGASKEQYRV